MNEQPNANSFSKCSKNNTSTRMSLKAPLKKHQSVKNQRKTSTSHLPSENPPKNNTLKTNKMKTTLQERVQQADRALHTFLRVAHSTRNYILSRFWMSGRSSWLRRMETILIELDGIWFFGIWMGPRWKWVSSWLWLANINLMCTMIERFRHKF